MVLHGQCGYEPIDVGAILRDVEVPWLEMTDLADTAYSSGLCSPGPDLSLATK